MEDIRFSDGGVFFDSVILGVVAALQLTFLFSPAPIHKFKCTRRFQNTKYMSIAKIS